MPKQIRIPLLLGCFAAHQAYAASSQLSDQTTTFWTSQGKAQLAALLSDLPAQKARNVILFVGDGMGLSTVAAARILEGQKRGHSGEENSLSFERFPHLALSKTYNTDAQVPDSAGTITAMLNGTKTRIGVLGIGPEPKRGLCGSSAAYRVPSLLEQAEGAGLATGVVTTTRITHATPAGTYAHIAERDWEADSNLTDEARAAGCHDIARQLVEFSYGDGIDVILGGGRQQLMPKTAVDPEYPAIVGKRADGRDLIKEWQNRRGMSAQYVWNRQQFMDAASQTGGQLLGLFEPSHMQYESQREGDAAGEPSLTEMTEVAIKRLSQHQAGYFLMVEAGRIDHAHHEGIAAKALFDTIELGRAVQRARELTHVEDTLIIVTADHGHTLSMAGYPVRGNPILGKIFDVETGAPAFDLLGLPMTTLSYANGPGAWQNSASPQASRPDLTAVDTEALEFMQHSAFPLASETHSGEDVPVYASGPNARLFHGVLEQNMIYYVMQNALALPTRTAAAKIR